MGLITKNHVLKKILLIFSMICLSGCSNGILSPHGEIVKQEYHLILTSVVMMLLIVIPVIFMTGYFVWKYRDKHSNHEATYSPNWNFSYAIEFFIWSIPCIIIFILAIISWRSTHNLEPSKPIVSNYHPINIEVVALDYQWLFIYPKYNIATINEIVFPIDTPILFHITSHSVMNSFFIPSLGSQIYAMNGMISKLYLIANDVGKYKGISANYSGRGFSDMKFSVYAVSSNDKFYDWVNDVKRSNLALNKFDEFKKLSKIDEHYLVKYFSNVLPNLFDQIVRDKN
ncbi:MAG: ubiquinol oxidase subunit II [Buchnera aphidicola (Eriosoma harunire)]